MTGSRESQSTRPIRILFLNHTSVMSGAEVGLLDLAASLDGKTFDGIVALPKPGMLSDALQRRNIRVVFLPLLRFVKTSNPVVLLSYMFNLLRTVPRIGQLILEENIDIVHSNSTTAHIYGGPAAFLSGRPCVWHCRDLVNLGLAGRWLCHTATRIVAISGAVAGQLHLYGNTAKIRTIPNGVDLRQFQPAGKRSDVRRELGVAPDSLLVAMAGQLIPWKRHSLFLRAASLIAAELPTARFLIIGDDLFGDSRAYREELETLARELKLTNRVTFLGHRTDFPRLLEGIDVLAHPADNEPFGRVVAEAMAMAKPVVAINSAGPAELIRDGQDGLLALPHDPVSIANAVVRIARDRSFACNLGRAAKTRIETNFSLERHTIRLQALYKEILARPARVVAPRDNMKLAYVVDNFPSLSETFVLREIVALEDDGFDVRIFSLNRSASLKVHSDASALLDHVRYPSRLISVSMLSNHCRVLTTSPLRYGAQAIMSLFRERHPLKGIRTFLLAADLAAVARRLRVDHVHAHFAFLPADVGIVMAHLLGKPFSLSVHARDIYTQDRSALAPKVRAASFVAACSTHGRERLLALLPEAPHNKIVLVRHGVFPNHVVPGSPMGSLILAVGRLVEKKGFTHLIQACRLLELAGVGFTCVIVGDGPLQAALEEEAVRCGIGDKVLLQGETTQEELKTLYGTARVLVVPSVIASDGDQDGVPNVIIEAMAAGIPVVGTTSGAIPEIVTDGGNGILVPPDNPQALAAAIRTILADATLGAKLGMEGRARVIKQFDISANVARLAELFMKRSR